MLKCGLIDMRNKVLRPRNDGIVMLERDNAKMKLTYDPFSRDHVRLLRLLQSLFNISLARLTALSLCSSLGGAGEFGRDSLSVGVDDGVDLLRLPNFSPNNINMPTTSNSSSRIIFRLTLLFW